MNSERLVSLLLLCGALLGCSPQSPTEQMLADYRDRVANVLEIEPPPIETPFHPLSPLPDRKQRILKITELRQGVIEVWDLKRCGLMYLISRRNSSLGKVMEPSQRLLYELRFWQTIDQCYKRLQEEADSDPEVIGKIADIRATKRDNLPRVYWNALFASDEFVHLFALAAPPYGPDDIALAANSLRSLSYLADLQTHLFDSELDLSSKALEQHYFQLQHEATNTRLLKSMLLTSAYLDNTALLIERRLARRPLCLQPSPTPQARVLRTVLFKFYMGRIQPYMAQLNRHGRQWLDTLNHIITRQRELAPPAIQRFRQQQLSQQNESAPWQQFQQAVARHTEAWQELLEQCGLMPKRSSLPRN